MVDARRGAELNAGTNACQHEGCERAACVQGLCRAHYGRQLHGSTSTTPIAPHKRSVSPSGATGRLWVIESLKAAHADLGGEHLSAAAYTRWRRDRDDVVSTSRVVQVFGTWSAAVRAAGLRAGSNRRGAYSRRFSQDDIDALARQFFIEQRQAEQQMSFSAFSRWLADRPDAPSSGLVRARLAERGLSWTTYRASTLGELD